MNPNLIARLEDALLLEPGRGLDVAVLMTCCDWRAIPMNRGRFVIREPAYVGSFVAGYTKQLHELPTDAWVEPCNGYPKVSTGIAAAWQLLDGLPSWAIERLENRLNGFHIHVGIAGRFGSAETAPHAICRARLALELAKERAK